MAALLDAVSSTPRVIHALRYSYVAREGEDKGERWSVQAPWPAWALGSAVHDRYSKAG